MDNEFGNFATEMNRGFLQLLVLALLEQGTYGYAMVRAIRGLGYEIEENTLYPLLRRLEKKKWIHGKWELGDERPRKFYAITDAGRSLRNELLSLWNQQDGILKKLLKEKKHVQ